MNECWICTITTYSARQQPNVRYGGACHSVHDLQPKAVSHICLHEHVLVEVC